jgi:protein-S-isoprenylcysteine O-methyltransferase Ste14
MLQGIRSLPDRAFRIGALVLVPIWGGLFWAGSQWTYAVSIAAANLWLVPYIRKTNREEEELRARLEDQSAGR